MIRLFSLGAAAAAAYTIDPVVLGDKPVATPVEKKPSEKEGAWTNI